MIHVGIVDDDPIDRENIIGHLRRYEKDRGVEFEIRVFSDGEQIVDGYRSDLDIIFLDVEMFEVGGFEAAHAIRARDPRAVIVFVTRLGHLATKGYEVDALSYLVKPVGYFAFAHEIGRALDRLTRSENAVVQIPTAGGLARVYATDIIFVESVKHRITVHAVDRQYVFSGTLKEIGTHILDKGFFRCSNSYIVNLRYVLGIEQSTCTMLGGRQITISRARRREFLDAVARQIGNRVRERRPVPGES